MTLCRRGVPAVDIVRTKKPSRTKSAGSELSKAKLLPYTAHHAFSLFDLPPHHADPFDRQIIAQAVCEKIPVVTCDEKFSLYKDLKVLW